MTIEQLDNKRIIIDLKTDDLDALGLKYETIGLKDPKTRKLLRRLMTLAGIKTGIDILDKSLYIEAMPYDMGCVLLITVNAPRPKEEPKKYRIKKDLNYTMFTFENTDDFLTSVRSLYEQGHIFTGSMVYHYKDKYCLIIYAQSAIPSKIKNHLLEFSESSTTQKIAIARVLEHGQPIAKRHAIMYIGSAII